MTGMRPLHGLNPVPNQKGVFMRTIAGLLLLFSLLSAPVFSEDENTNAKNTVIPVIGEVTEIGADQTYMIVGGRKVMTPSGMIANAKIRQGSKLDVKAVKEGETLTAVEAVKIFDEDQWPSPDLFGAGPKNPFNTDNGTKTVTTITQDGQEHKKNN